ncbi:hypothetical protein Acsp05_52570 [Actinokineospora sp. NBRC 105648]|nr:hypothetical protein Acsp05_52570 [Actinokineospora sp. NBRC 105648]
MSPASYRAAPPRVAKQNSTHPRKPTPTHPPLSQKEPHTPHKAAGKPTPNPTQHIQHIQHTARSPNAIGEAVSQPHNTAPTARCDRRSRERAPHHRSHTTMRRPKVERAPLEPPPIAPWGSGGSAPRNNAKTAPHLRFPQV